MYMFVQLLTGKAITVNKKEKRGYFCGGEKFVY